MTSIIKVDTIQNKAGSTTLDADKLPDMYTSSPKAFSSTNAAGTTINESFNISSLGDTATGRQLLSFTNNMNGSTYMSNANANSSQMIGVTLAVLLSLPLNAILPVMMLGKLSRQ